MASGTKQRVKELCDELFAQGERPTHSRIRALLGPDVTPSSSTLKAAIDEWYREAGARYGALIELPDVPDAVAEKAGAFIRDLWQTAVNEAGALWDGERASLRERIDLMTVDLDEARAEARQCAERVRAHEKRLAENAETIEALTQERARLRKEAEALRESRSRLEAVLREREDLVRVLEQRLSDERERGERQEAHFLREIDRWREAHKESARQSEALNGEIVSLRERLGKANAELAAARATAADLERRLKDEANTRKALEADLAKTSARLKRLEQEREAAREAAAQARSESARLAARVESAESRCASLEARNAQLGQLVESLKAAIDRLSAKPPKKRSSGRDK